MKQNKIQYMNRAAFSAGQLIRKAFGDSFQIDEKEKKENVSDFVTTIDNAADAEIIKTLRNACPDIPVVTEESGGQQSEKYFLVDPLDGTTNFIAGIDYVAVSIAYVENNIVKAGCVYDPLRDNMFSAERGMGAFLNTKPLKVSDTSLNRSVLIQEENFGGSHQKKILERTALLTPGIAGLRKTGSTALDLAYLAAGKPWIVLATSLKSWDVAGGSIIASEAGAKLTTLSGKEFSLNSETILAASPHLHQTILDRLQSQSKLQIDALSIKNERQ